MTTDTDWTVWKVFMLLKVVAQHRDLDRTLSRAIADLRSGRIRL